MKPTAIQPYAAPTVIVKRSFLTAMVSGFFGVMISLIVCGTALTLFGLYIADNTVFRLIGEVRGGLADWRDHLPAIVTDALHDRRAPEYREQVDVRARFVGSDELRRGGDIVLEVENRGDAIVTLMNVRVSMLDDREVPVREYIFAAATPITSDGGFHGPIQPASNNVPTRRVLAKVTGAPIENGKLLVEVTDLRVWTPPKTEIESAASSTASARE
jgi:hypothetical protein